MGLHEGRHARLLAAGKADRQRLHRAFNGRFRAECLNAHWFLTLADAAEKMEDWRRYYNEVRPHGAIGHNVPISSLNHDGAATLPT
ncbi:transposase [Mesorhizobium microcysteis]|uniref:Transposase n=1 Tax=Neoaquamicrobium microcysteis TaxID=2682781 RepID=A0A5D4H972_9HYPH|nr:transposase [Mesorhizobium microcysteis]